MQIRRGLLLSVSLPFLIPMACVGDEPTPTNVVNVNADGGAQDGAIGADSASADGSVDAGLDVAPTGFALIANPAHVTLDPNGSTNVEITVQRGTSFSDAIDIIVQNLGADLIANPGTLLVPSTETSATFNLKANANAATPQDLAVKLIGTSKRDSSLGASVDLEVRVGTFFMAVDTDTVLDLPSWATSIDLKVWGAGGGAGGKLPTATGEAWGGVGGGGGFAGARVPVDPTKPLTIVVGTGGQGGGNADSRGGAGGGYSAVKQEATLLAVAGGGGGGSGAQSRNNGGQCYFESLDLDGFGGGGGNAQPTQNTNRSAITAAGGAATIGGGGSNGSSLAGGDAANPIGSAGSPGGGRGGLGYTGCQSGGGGGGGGAGFFGGAGGTGGLGWQGGLLGFGGGGGSGTVIAGATAITQSAASSSTPAAQADPDYASQAGLGGAKGTNGGSAGAGKNGRVVVRFVSN